MRDQNGPRITIGGKLMVEVPTDLTVQMAFSNFEELARGMGGIDAGNRLVLLRSLVTLGELAGVMPEKTSPRVALSNFEAIARAHSCNHELRMALLQSVDLLEDLVEKAEEAEEAKSKSEETDGSSEAASSPEEGTSTSSGSPAPPLAP